MYDSKRVEFQTLDGTILRGDFFQASGDQAPCIVMTQGLSLLKEHYIRDHARLFVEAGISALVYDHRGYGSSFGMPRHETNPLQQAEDYHDAVSAAMHLPWVDPKRIAIWGIGHSGGAAMIAAASEPRVKAIILFMPFQSGRNDAKNFPAGTMERVWSDRQEKTAKGDATPIYVQLWLNSIANAKGEEGERTFLAGEVPYNFITGAVKLSDAVGTPWSNKITLQSFYYLSKVEPRLFVPFIDPEKLLYLAAEQDPITGTLEEHRAVFATAKPGAEFAVVKPDHLGTYAKEFIDDAMAPQISFLKRKFA